MFIYILYLLISKGFSTKHIPLNIETVIGKLYRNPIYFCL